MFYEFDHPLVPDYFKKETGHNFDFPAHIHYCYELIVIDSGEMNVTVNDTEYSLTAGDAVLVFPNQIHSMNTPERSAHTLFIFAPNLVSAFTKAVGDRVPLNNQFRVSSLHYELIRRMKRDAGILDIKGLLYTLCAEFDKSTEYLDVGGDPKSLLYRTFRFIQKNYKGDCTLEALSHHTGYDYAYLSRYFKRIVGIYFNDYVNQVRISHACYLLSNTDMSVNEICGECGFKSLRSLNRNFKDTVGATPTGYRRSPRNA